MRILRQAGKGANVGFLAKTSFNRQDFGVRYKHREIPDFVGDEIAVTLRILTRPPR